MERTMIKKLEGKLNEEVKISGWVHRIRRLKSISFIIIRDRSGLVQTVFDNSTLEGMSFRLESVVEVLGTVAEGKNDLGNYEIHGSSLNVISEVKEELPIEVNTEEVNANLDTILNNRVLSLRNKKLNSIFKVEDLIAQGFREYLISQDFTEIFTPKIVAEGTEGGTEMFEVKYFEKKAYLAQSPQFYKQMMVAAGYERVFEIGHAYRAEEHNTNRHLNEYVSMDLEMGFIEDERDVMDLEENLLKYIFNKVGKEGVEYLKLFGAEVPSMEKPIPRMRFSEALELLKREYGKELEGDLDPEGEKLICSYVKEKYNSDFLFLTHYPRKKRPMYTMPCGENETHSFDLLFRGIEITTGGQRIHNYEQLVENIKYKGFVPENYPSYINVFKFGVPKHGGLAIGLERVTEKLLGLNNIREASFIPRDRTRLVP